MPARAHQDAVRDRQRHANPLRSLLREIFLAALITFPDLKTKTAMTNLTDLLRAAGRGTQRVWAALEKWTVSAVKGEHSTIEE